MLNLEIVPDSKPSAAALKMVEAWAGIEEQEDVTDAMHQVAQTKLWMLQMGFAWVTNIMSHLTMT